MISQAETAIGSSPDVGARERVYEEGIVAGLLGAGAVAVWFLLLDSLAGQPLRTPAMLGTAIFGGGGGAASPSRAALVEPVILYTWVHGLVFCVIGGLAANLLAVAERRPNAGFGILLLFVAFEFGFLVVTLLFAEPVLRALTWPAILVGNLLAAAAMSAYFWRRHPQLRIFP
jgi:hypothetical protein